MRVLIHDEYAAGREPADAVETSHADINRALVAALAVDLAAIAGHEARVSSARYADTLADDLGWADAAVLLAATTDDRLATLCEQCEAAGVRVLGPSSTAVRHLADRMGLTLALGEAGIPTPRSWLIDVARDDQWQRISQRIGFPVVVKPLAWDGGRGAQLVADAADLMPTVAATAALTCEGELLLQEHGPGLAAGVGILHNGDQVTALGLWGALLAAPPALTIERVATPLDHDGVGAALAIAVAAARAIPGLLGLVEVNLVLGAAGPVVIDITPGPRLGMLALRRSRQVNLAALLLDAAAHGRLPDPRFWPPERPVMLDADNPAVALAPDPWSS